MDATNEHSCFRKQTESTEAGYLWKCLSSIDNAYNEILKWPKNTFLVPYGKVGRGFIDKMTEHINDWNNGSKKQPIALKAVTAFLAVGLHKPRQMSKAKDHQEYYLSDWYCGMRVNSTNYCAKDGYLSNSRMVDPPNAARVFANLVMSGQINSALLYLSENDGGVLPLIEDVMAQLRQKHPNPQEARLGPLLFGPVEGVPDSIYQQINGEIVGYATLRTKGSGVPQALMRMGSGEFLHQMYSGNLEQTCAQQEPQ